MTQPRPSSDKTLTAVLAYACFATLWVVVSDAVVGFVFKDPATITRVSTIKGGAFIAVTSALLFVLLRRLTGPSGAPFPPVGSRRSLVLPVVMLTAAIGALSASETIRHLRHHRDMELGRLGTIAELKTRQIADWLAERQGDARSVATNPDLAESYRRWRAEGTVAELAALQERLDAFRTANAFEAVVLLDERGDPLWRSAGGLADPGPSLRAAAREAAATRQVGRSGPHRDAAGRLHLDFLAPLNLAGAAAPLVVLHTDPAATLFRVLQEWPEPSRSAESLLFRREHERVQFLSGLKNAPDTAVRYSVPARATILAEAWSRPFGRDASLLIEGPGYAGEPIVGAVRAVPGTDWFLAVQVDRAELLAEATGDALWISAAGLLALCAALGGLFILLQRRQIASTLRERAVQMEKLQALRLLEAVSESSNDAIFAKDVEGKYLLFNREAARLVGKPALEVLGRDDRDLFPPAEAEQLMSIGRQVIAENRVLTYEEELSTAVGRRVFLTTKGPLHDELGKIIGIFGISRDITDRREAEDALRDREERLRLALQSAGQGLYDLNVQTGEAIVSPEYVLMLGYDPSDFHETNAALIERLHPDDRRPVSAVYRDFLAGKLPVYRVEFRQRTAAGEWKWILSLGRIVQRDEQGRPLRMLGTHTDITARKAAEEALRENEAFTRAVLDNLPIGIAVNSVFSEVNFVYMNDAFARCYRTTRDRLARADAFWEAVYEDPVFREQIRARVLADCASGDPRRMFWADVPITRAGTETRYVTAMNTPIPGGDLMISAVWDVTERTRAEAERARLEAQLIQAQKMESVGRLAGGVAHDFNNLLFVIMGHVAMAMEGLGPGQPIHAHLEEIRRAAQRSADLTRQLLAFARRQTVAPRVLDLNQTVSAMLSMLRRLIGEDIDLDWLPGEGLWPVKIDPAQVDQVLANLCVNSRDAIEGVGKIAIETRNVTLDPAAVADRPGLVAGDHVLLRVRDDGCGMGQEVLDHLFEPFYTTKGVGRGTGLGLATVYGIVKQNEGFVSVLSEPARGTTVSIYLPRCAEAGVCVAAEPAGELPLACGETVLLVDDEASVLNLGAAMLERLGYAVQSAGGAAEALRLVEAHPGAVGLLITDVIMPGMNGRDLARRLTEKAPHLKCLFMSAYTADVIAQRGLLPECVQFIQKPFAIGELAVKVREALQGGGGRTGAGGGQVGADATAPGLRVLYVDDEESLLDLVERFLGRRGHRVVACADPHAALAEFRRRPADFDFVVTDLAMPGLSGLSLVRELLGVRADVPIAVVSGHLTTEERCAVQALGVHAAIEKPGTVEQLAAALDRLFRTGVVPEADGTAFGH